MRKVEPPSARPERSVSPEPPVRKRRYAAAFFVPLGMFLVLLLSGIRFWPNAPIRERHGVYLDKFGTEQGEATYRRFRLWETALVVSFVMAAAGFVVGLFREGSAGRTTRLPGS